MTVGIQIPAALGERLKTKPRRRCLICGELGFLYENRVHDRLFSAPGEWSILECPSAGCRLMWLDPQPEASELHKLYYEYFTHPHSELPKSWSRSFWCRFCDTAAAEALGFPAPHGSSSTIRALAKLVCTLGVVREFFGGLILWVRPEWRGRLLDIGCGAGELLRRLKLFGWKVEGLEPDPSAAAFALRKSGILVHEGVLPQSSIPYDSFDVITLSHVIEHLSDPLNSLQEYMRLLRPGGRLVVATPNTSSLGRSHFEQDWVHLDPPRHLTLFTAQTLKAALERAGFCVENIRTSSRSTRFVWYQSQLISKDKGGSRPGLLLQIKGAFMQVFEHYFFRSQGEELVALATRPRSGAVPVCHAPNSAEQNASVL